MRNTAPFPAPGRPSPGFPVAYSVTSGAWQANSAIRASDGVLAIDRTFYSPVMGQTVSISVLVPSDYLTSGIDYPVNFHLHGLSKLDLSAPGNRYAASWYPGVYGAARTAGAIRPHITVFPNGFGRSMWIDDYLGALLVERYLIQDVVPWVRANYRTLLPANKTAITGFSMGGNGALYYGLKYPGTFGAVAAMGSPFYASNADFAGRTDVNDWGTLILSPGNNYTAAERARWHECSPRGWFSRNPTKPAIYLSHGGDDGLTLDLNITMRTDLTTAGIPYTAGLVPAGVGHNSADMWGSAAGSEALAWLEARWAA